MSKSIKTTVDGLDVFWDGANIYRPPQGTLPRQDYNLISKPVQLYFNNSTKAASSFTCNLSESYKNFSFLVICCRYGNNSSDNLNDLSGTMIIPTASVATNVPIHYEINYAGSTNGLGRRIFTFKSDTQLTAAAGGYNNATNNGYIIPFMILGIR